MHKWATPELGVDPPPLAFCHTLMPKGAGLGPNNVMGYSCHKCQKKNSSIVVCHNNIYDDMHGDMISTMHIPHITIIVLMRLRKPDIARVK